MRVFITGASGYIGQAVAEAFRQAGHAVSGMVRSHNKAQLLYQQEITPVIGDLAKPASYLSAVQQAEVIVHCAFDYAGHGVDTEKTAIDTLLQGAHHAGISTRAILYTSGVWCYGNTGIAIADEASHCHPIDIVKWRNLQEERLLKLASSQLRVVIIRPGCVYGGSGGLSDFWFSSAKAGSCEIVGPGNNRWAMIHYRDLAEAYVRAAERELNHAVINVVDNTRYTVKEMALGVADAAGIPEKIHSLSPAEATQKYGMLTHGLLIDQQISNERAKRLLDWQPRHTGFLSDVASYYAAWQASPKKNP